MAKKAETKPVKGTRDFLPADIYRREHVTGIIREIYEAHGFVPLETPAFERLETLLGKYGDEGDQLLFKIAKRGAAFVESLLELPVRRWLKFNLTESTREFIEHHGMGSWSAGDWQKDEANTAADSLATLGLKQWMVTGRAGQISPLAEQQLADLGLRYDLTVPLARVYAEQQGKLPAVFRRYQIQPVWRADNPGKGRFREFYQCDVDVVGATSLVAEAEVVGAVGECLRRLGFTDFEIKLNHRKLLTAFIEKAGIDSAKAAEAIVAIDKLDKIGAEGVDAELAAKGIGEEGRKTLLALMSGRADLGRARELLSGHEVGLAALAEVEQVLALSRVTPAADRVVYDPTLARGLGYYTGCIFEIAVKDLAGSLGGGGRYDGLIGMFLGRDVPAVGFSLGLERILVVMEQQNMFPDSIARRPEVLVAAIDPASVEDALAIAYELRQAGLRVELSPKADKPGQVRKSADERAIGFAVLIKLDAIYLWKRSEPSVTDRAVPRSGLAIAIAAPTA